MPIPEEQLPRGDRSDAGEREILGGARRGLDHYTTPEAWAKLEAGSRFDIGAEGPVCLSPMARSNARLLRRSEDEGGPGVALRINTRDFLTARTLRVSGACHSCGALISAAVFIEWHGSRLDCRRCRSTISVDLGRLSIDPSIDPSSNEEERSVVYPIGAGLADALLAQRTRFLDLMHLAVVDDRIDELLVLPNGSEIEDIWKKEVRYRVGADAAKMSMAELLALPGVRAMRDGRIERFGWPLADEEGDATEEEDLGRFGGIVEVAPPLPNPTGLAVVLAARRELEESGADLESFDGLHLMIAAVKRQGKRLRSYAVHEELAASVELIGDALASVGGLLATIALLADEARARSSGETEEAAEEEAPLPVRFYEVLAERKGAGVMARKHRGRVEGPGLGDEHAVAQFAVEKLAETVRRGKATFECAVREVFVADPVRSGTSKVSVFRLLIDGEQGKFAIERVEDFNGGEEPDGEQTKEDQR